MERIVYPGSFRPFHLQHLANINMLQSKFTDCSIIIAVSNNCPRSEMLTQTAIEVVRLSMPEELASHVRIVEASPNPLESIKILNLEKITHVATGSDRTISILKLLTLSGYWSGKIIKLNNSGIHATQIREWMKKDDARWKECLAPKVVSFLESTM